MRDRDMQMILQALDKEPPVTDKEVKIFMKRDLYNSLIQFGDPFMFVHLNADAHKRFRDLEFSHFHQIVELNRGSYILLMEELFPGVRMLSCMNVQRFCRDHRLEAVFRHHVIVRTK